MLNPADQGSQIGSPASVWERVFTAREAHLCSPHSGNDNKELKAVTIVDIQDPLFFSIARDRCLQQEYRFLQKIEFLFFYCDKKLSVLLSIVWLLKEKPFRWRQS